MTAAEVIEIANRRMEALENALIFYRFGTRTTENLFKELAFTEKAWKKILSGVDQVVGGA